MSFTFKQFHIDDTGCGQPVSQDAVLLGAWAYLPDKGRVLDLGTGSGLLALMAAQRKPDTQITALELEPHAANMARHNVASSPWSDRVAVIEADMLTWVSTQRSTQSDKFDAIVCNPPWFTSGLRATGAQRAQARHQDTLTLPQLFSVVSRALKPTGQASVLLPSEEADSLEALLAECSLYVYRRCLLHTTPHKPARRQLLSLGLQPRKTEEQQLLVRDQHGVYTAEFVRLTQAFYLKF